MQLQILKLRIFRIFVVIYKLLYNKSSQILVNKLIIYRTKNYIRLKMKRISNINQKRLINLINYNKKFKIFHF